MAEMKIRIKEERVSKVVSLVEGLVRRQVPFALRQAGDENDYEVTIDDADAIYLDVIGNVGSMYMRSGVLGNVGSEQRTNLLLMQTKLNQMFGEIGDGRLAEMANDLSELTGLWQDGDGVWEEVK